MAPPISSAAPRSAPSVHRAPEAARPPPSPAPAAPAASPTADRHRDAFVADGAARDRMAHATGRGATEQVNFGRFVASGMADHPVDWAHPADTLRSHSQIDSSDATRGDTDRCGATALVGGIVMSGPEAPRRLADARTRMETRLGEVDADIGRSMSRDWANPDAGGFVASSDAREAHRMLDGLPRDTSTWTHGDLSRFEEASYRLGRAEGAMHGDRSSGGLSGEEMVRMRDTMWGSETTRAADGTERTTPWRPHTADGRDVDVVFEGTRDLGGDVTLNHFVLGTDGAVPGTDGRRSVVYDPWPGEDGTNFVRTEATDPARPIGAVAHPGVFGRDPAVPGLDLDWWRPD